MSTQQERVDKLNKSLREKKKAPVPVGLDGVAQIVSIIEATGSLGDILGRTLEVDLELTSGEGHMMGRIKGTVTQKGINKAQLNIISQKLHLMREYERQSSEEELNKSKKR